MQEKHHYIEDCMSNDWIAAFGKGDADGVFGGIEGDTGDCSITLIRSGAELSIPKIVISVDTPALLKLIVIDCDDPIFTWVIDW